MTRLFFLSLVSRDLGPFHGQVAMKPWIAGAIDDPAVANHQIVGRFVPRSGRAAQKKNEAEQKTDAKPELG